MVEESTVLLRAGDFDCAFERALEIGRGRENEYQNGFGKRVRWVFTDVLSLDIVHAESLDGAEVHSNLTERDPADPMSIDQEFSPELSSPSQTT